MIETPRTDKWLKDRAPKQVVSTWADVVALAEFARSLERENAELRTNANRYILLRDGQNWPAAFDGPDAPEPLREDHLDEACDAARSK